MFSPKGNDKEAAARRKAGTGCVARWFGLKLLLFGLVGVIMLPSTWRYIRQAQAHQLRDPAELLTLPHDTWVIGRIRPVLDEDLVELKKLGRQKHSTPVEGTGRAVFFQWTDFKRRPEPPKGEIEINGRIEDADSWLDSTWVDRLRHQCEERELALPPKLRKIKNAPPPTSAMFAWRVGFHLVSIGCVFFVIGRWYRGHCWGRDPDAMRKSLQRGEAVDYTKGPPPL